MTAASTKPLSPIAQVLIDLRTGLGAEDIASRRDIPVTEVRRIIAELRAGGFLASGRPPEFRGTI